MEYGEVGFGSEERRTKIDRIDYSIWPGPNDENVLEPGTVVKLKGSNQPYGIVHSYDPARPDVISVIDNMSAGIINRHNPMVTTFNTEQIEVYDAP